MLADVCYVYVLSWHIHNARDEHPKGHLYGCGIARHWPLHHVGDLSGCCFIHATH